MSALTESTIYIFGIVALGFLAAWSGVLRGHGEQLAEFATSIAVPALLFRTMITSDFAASGPWLIWAVYFAAAAASWALGQALAYFVLRRDGRGSIIAGVASGFSNLVLLGLPFTLAVFGHEGVSILSLIVAVHLPTMLAVSIVMFAAAGGENAPRGLAAVREFAVTLATNAMIVGIVAGLAWRLTGLDMPALPMRLVDTFAGVAGPLALFAMGMGLGRFPLKANFAQAFLMALLKLGFMPAVALALAVAVDLPPLVAKVVVVSASLPTGVNPYLFAVRFGTGQGLASNSLTVGTLLAAFSTAFWLSVSQAVFG
ncbi:MAG: AEC family transporter [Rhizobiaceae bacterium]|nr:AEC family transporter [Rhizobiaceae bacterium]